MIPNYNILKFQKETSLLYTNREYSFSVPKIIAEQRKIPPFQVIRQQLINSPITKFELTRCETGTTIDILSEMNAAGLSIQEGGEIENYDSTSLVVQSADDNKCAWSQSIGGSFTKFRFLRCWMYCDDIDNIPTQFRARILDAYGGTQMAESAIVTISPKYKQSFSIMFDFGSVYDNSILLDNLYLEVAADGVWSPYGKDVYSGQTMKHTTYTGTEDTTDYATVSGTDAASDTYSWRVVGTKYGGNYDVIVNDGTAIDLYLDKGTYSIEMSDGINTWYSEKFIIMDYIHDKIKLTYWHNNDLSLPNNLGTMRYYDGYKNELILMAKVRSPEYLVEKEVIEKNLEQLTISSSSSKRYQFKFLASEYMLDAIRLIDLHHNIQMEYEGKLITVQDFAFNIEGWDDKGYYAYCKIEFTEQDMVTTSGSASLDGTYIPQEVLDITFPTEIDIDAIGYDYETDEEILEADRLTYSTKVASKYVIVNNAGTRTLWEWSGSLPLTQIIMTAYDVVKLEDSTGETYYYNSAGSLVTDSEIVTVTNTGGFTRNVTGRTFKTAYVQVEYELAGSTFVMSPVSDGLEFINNGIDIDPAGGIVQFRLHVFGKDKTFSVSPWKANV